LDGVVHTESGRAFENVIALDTVRPRQGPAARLLGQEEILVEARSENREIQRLCGQQEASPTTLLSVGERERPALLFCLTEAKQKKAVPLRRLPPLWRHAGSGREEVLWGLSISGRSEGPGCVG